MNELLLMVQEGDPVVVSFNLLQLAQIMVAIFMGTSPVLYWAHKQGKSSAVREEKADKRIELLEDTVEELKGIAKVLGRDITALFDALREVNQDVEVERRVVTRLEELRHEEEE